ncbi:MAG TPA: hypothetical protein VLU73_14250 [Methylococcaceae bacterium]|nr:hypothetical protein [Methylococcaceae bacterium]
MELLRVKKEMSVLPVIPAWIAGQIGRTADLHAKRLKGAVQGCIA